MPSESELRTLPRKLAERLISETDNFGDCSLDIAIAKAEAVILEAIEQTLDVAEHSVMRVIVPVDEKYESIIRHAAISRCAEAIRSLKPAKPEAVK
jgi:hypothetical protein